MCSRRACCCWTQSSQTGGYCTPTRPGPTAQASTQPLSGPPCSIWAAEYQIRHDQSPSFWRMICDTPPAQSPAQHCSNPACRLAMLCSVQIGPPLASQKACKGVLSALPNDTCCVHAAMPAHQPVAASFWRLFHPVEDTLVEAKELKWRSSSSASNARATIQIVLAC